MPNIYSTDPDRQSDDYPSEPARGRDRYQRSYQMRARSRRSGYRPVSHSGINRPHSYINHRSASNRFFTSFFRSAVVIFLVFSALSFLAGGSSSSPEVSDEITDAAENAARHATPMLSRQLSYMISKGPLPLDYDTDITIDDQLNIITKQNSLISCLKQFQDRTGITVCLAAVPEEHKLLLNSSVTKRASDYYTEHWHDESHWLLYYTAADITKSDSIADNISNIISNNMSGNDIKSRSADLQPQWVLYTGDDCPLIVSRKAEYAFKHAVQSDMDTGMSFEDAVVSSLPDVETAGKLNTGNVGYEPGPTVLAIIFIFLLIKLVWYIILNISLSIWNHLKSSFAGDPDLYDIYEDDGYIDQMPARRKKAYQNTSKNNIIEQSPKAEIPTCFITRSDTDLSENNSVQPEYNSENKIDIIFSKPTVSTDDIPDNDTAVCSICHRTYDNSLYRKCPYCSMKKH